MRRPYRSFILILFPIVLLAVGACSSEPEEISFGEPSYIRLSLVSPPDTPYEIPERLNDPAREIWRPGFWSYDGATFTWQPGYIMPKPSPTSVWSPDHWEKREYGFAFVKGYWQ